MFEGIDWMQLATVIGVPIVLLAGGFLTRWLKGKANEQAELASQQKLGGRQFLKSQVLESLLMSATNIANKELKELKEANGDGKVTKEELKLLGDKAINDVKVEFAAAGRDLVKELGPTFLSEGLRYVVDKMSGDEAPAKKTTTKKKTTRKK